MEFLCLLYAARAAAGLLTKAAWQIAEIDADSISALKLSNVCSDDCEANGDTEDCEDRP